MCMLLLHASSLLGKYNFKIFLQFCVCLIGCTGVNACNNSGETEEVGFTGNTDLFLRTLQYHHLFL